jgi:tetratricopeptide (TPR) repeat protein
METNKSTLMPVLLIVLFAFTTFAQQQPRTAADYVEAGLAAQKANHFDEALAQYEAAIKLDAADFGAQFNSGVCYMALRKWEEALKAFKIAVALKPNEAIVHRPGKCRRRKRKHARSNRCSQGSSSFGSET